MIVITDINPHYNIVDKDHRVGAYTVNFRCTKKAKNEDVLKLNGSLTFKTELDFIDLPNLKSRILSNLNY